MKYLKWVICFLIFILLILLIYSKTTSLKNIKTTNLSNISCDGMYLLDEFEDNNNYKPSNKFSEQGNVIYYDECYIKIDESNRIALIHANFNDIDISVNSNNNLNSIDDITEILGTNYKNDWYDKEQQLKQLIYIDHENDIQSTFIYNTYADELVWLITEKIY